MALSRSEEKLFLKFMETTIKRVNSCMARVWMLEKLMIEKGVAPEEIQQRIKEAENRPEHLRNAKVLEDMITEFNKTRKNH